MSLRNERTAPRLGIIEPCLPSPAKAPPSGPGWLHEIKHDGYRILARRDRTGVRLITRNGSDFTDRFPYMAAALELLPVRSCIIDGEAIVCDESGVAVFELIRSHGSKMSAVLCAFDLLAGFCLSAHYSIRFPNGATLIAGSFQAFIGNFRPELFQLRRVRFTRVPISIIRSPRHLEVLWLGELQVRDA